MAINVGVGGAYKNVNNVKVGVGGTWKQVQSAWVGVGGVWKKIWDYLSADAIALNAVSTDGTNGPVYAGGIYNSNGKAYSEVYGAAPVEDGTWLLVGTNTDFEIYLSGTGNTPAGDALNTWLSLGTTRIWSLSDGGGGGVSSFNGTVQIRRAADQVVVDTAALSLYIESST